MAANYTLYRNYSTSDSICVEGLFEGSIFPQINAVENDYGDTFDWSREGYDFIGWNTAIDGSGTLYNSGDSVPSSPTIYYAIWQESTPTYDVTISYKGSSIATINTSGTTTLNTAGTYCEDDIEIEYTRPSAPQPTLQSKTVSPSTSQQTVSPDSGYDGLSSVTVNAMPSGSATTPATSINISNKMTVSVSSAGALSATVDATTSVTPTVVAGYVSSGTAGNVRMIGAKFGSLTTQPAQTITPTTSDQTIAAQTYLTGVQTIKGDANLIASNIKDGTSIFGITGTYTGGGSPALQSKTVTPSGATQTVTADSGYDGLDIVTVNPITLKMGVLLPAAELVQTYSYDKYIHADESVTIPAYSTTAATLKASQTLTPTVSLNLTNYDYYVLERFLTIPTYNTTTKQKGRPVYQIYSTAYEIISIPGNTFKDGNTSYASRYTAVTPTGGSGKCIYWSNGTTVTAGNHNSYGVYQSSTAPSISSAASNTPTLTLNSPVLYIRGSGTYLTSAVWSTLTDIRYQYKIEVYRIPKSTYNLDGWNLTTQLDHLIECADSSSHNLT